MRRKDREVKEEKRILEIIDSCDCCRIGVCDGNIPYIVPLNFAHCMENGKHVFYFHSAKSGKKIDLIRQNKQAAIELDTAHRLQSAKEACGYSFGYQSLMGQGEIEIVEDMQTKKAALQKIMEHYSGKSDWKFQDVMAESVAVIRFEVSELTCKENPTDETA